MCSEGRRFGWNEKQVEVLLLEEIKYDWDQLLMGQSYNTKICRTYSENGNHTTDSELLTYGRYAGCQNPQFDYQI